LNKSLRKKNPPVLYTHIKFL